MLSIKDFGSQLLRTRDLDPVYVALDSAMHKLTSQQLAQLLITYWCVYHMGVAARLAEVKSPSKFWAMLMAVAVNESNADGSKPYPRAPERRHFRGQQAVDAVFELTQKYKTAEHALDGFVGAPSALGGGYTFAVVSSAVKTHRGFGDWIAFKVADMCERVLAVDVDFSDCALGIYKDPRQGAALARYIRHTEKYGSVLMAGVPYTSGHKAPWELPITDQELSLEVAAWVAEFRKLRIKAPPRGDRQLNVQEIETIFCKYKSHAKGHYKVGEDCVAVQQALTGWGDLASELKKGVPPWPQNQS